MKYIIAIFLTCLTLSARAQHSDISSTGEFKITGMVKHELVININDLLQFPQESLKDIVFKNSHSKDKEHPHQMKGVLLKTLLDSAEITAANNKEYGELIITLVASDNYRNIYSWNELFNTDIGNHVYVVTEMDGKSIAKMRGHISAISLSDINTGMRNLKALSRIEVKKMP